MKRMMARLANLGLFIVCSLFCNFVCLHLINKCTIAQSPNNQSINKPDSQRKDGSTPRLEKKVTQVEKKDTIRENAIYLARAVNSQSFNLDTKEQVWVKVQIARVLVGVSKEESIRILEEDFTLLHSLEKNLLKHPENQKEKEELKGLERELIALYCKLAPDKGQREVKRLLDSVSKTDSLESPATNPMDARKQADELANLARSLLQIGNPLGVEVLIKSILITGKISTKWLSAIADAGKKPELLRRLESALSSVLKGKVTADAEDIGNLSVLLIGSMLTQQSTRLAILEFELNSLRQIEMIVRTAREQGQPASINGDSIGYIYSTFNSPLLRMFIKEMPGSEKEVTALLKSLAGSLPGDWAASAQRDFGGMTFEQRLEEASSHPLGEKREELLIELAEDVLRSKFKEEAPLRRQMLDKVLNKITSLDSKVILTDYLFITEAQESTIQGDYTLAADKARQVSRGDWRGLTLAGIASAAEGKDHDEAVRLYMQALIGLDNCTPSITRVEVAFNVAEVMRKADSVLSQSLITRAVQYANAIDFTEQKKPKKFPDHYARIGKIFLILGMEAFQEKDVLRYCNIGELARQDWAGLYQSSQSIENHLLQAIFQIKMCEGVLSPAK